MSKLEGKVAIVTDGGPAAVYLVSDASRHLSGHRLVATGWSPEDPDGHASGIGARG